MLYRYRMHVFADPMAPLGPGRPLFARTPAEAISNAADLWNAGSYADALGYCVVDTEAGAAPWRSTAAGWRSGWRAGSSAGSRWRGAAETRRAARLAAWSH